MKNWRDVGEIVRERGRRFLSEYAKRELSQDRGPAQCVLDVPVDCFAQGFLADDASFVKRRKTREELDAFYANDGATNGRPREDVTRQAATIAHYFYDAWRRENDKRAIRDYGHRGEMKDYAAEAVVEDFFVWLQFSKWPLLFPAKSVETAIEIVRGLMEKPKQRRDPGKGAWIDFPASKQGLWLPPKPPENRWVLE